MYFLRRSVRAKFLKSAFAFVVWLGPEALLAAIFLNFVLRFPTHL